MRLFTVLGILFYAGILILIGGLLIVFGIVFFFNLLQAQELNNLAGNIIGYIQSNRSSGIIIGLCGLLLILISFSFAQLILGRLQREKTIAFATPSGKVTVALTLIEDLIKRLEGIIPEIKELRPDVIATKKGVVVDLRVILRSEANIHELTARLQEITRSKILEVLPIEEQIIIKIHVAKIMSLEEKERRKREPAKEEPTIPFSGYGRV
jgi:uncharacterized alkaline shock family protein YloU